MYLENADTEPRFNGGQQITGMHLGSELIQRSSHQTEVDGTDELLILLGNIEEWTSPQQDPWPWPL